MEEELEIKLGMFEQQIMQLQQQLQAINQANFEITKLNQGLDDLIGSKDKEILASLGKGIFANAKLASEDLVVDIGEGNFVKKSIPETKKIIEKQLVKLEDVRKEIEENLVKIDKEMTQLVLDSTKKK